MANALTMAGFGINEGLKGEWKNAAALMGAFAAVVALSLVFWNVHRIKNGIRFMQYLLGGIAVMDVLGSGLNVALRGTTGSWTTGIWMLVTAFWVLSFFPRQDPDKRSEVGAILSSQGMDERRDQIEAKAGAAGLLLVTVLAAAATGLSVIYYAVTTMELGVWPPALGMFTLLILVRPVMLWVYTRRM